ncbi:MAG TPA: hypothetical protein VFN30_00030 [Chitinophagaceae bacterium]|nr:hypothetical protein [Chitinophagaceae bacterium]
MNFYFIPRISVMFLLLSLSVTSNSQKKRTRYYDAHVHLSLYNGNAIDSLVKYGVYGVRDCGGNYSQLKQLREEISLSNRKWPKIYFSGPFLDGPKNSSLRSKMTLTVTTQEEAMRAVDSLKKLGVDFIKTHNALSKENYFAILRHAKANKLKVVSHLPKGVPVWEAADMGVSCVEHMAESILASPIYAGYAKTPQEAVSWWLTSPKADSVILRMKKNKIFITPTLVAFEKLIELTADTVVKSQLRDGLQNLMKITYKFYKAGIPLLAGSDFYTNEQSKINFIPGVSLWREVELLMESGLPKKEAEKTASANFEKWLKFQ